MRTVWSFFLLICRGEMVSWRGRGRGKRAYGVGNVVICGEDNGLGSNVGDADVKQCRRVVKWDLARNYPSSARV